MAEVWLLVKIICSPVREQCATGLFGVPYRGEQARAECLTQAAINDISFKIGGVLGGWGCAPDVPSATPSH